MEQDLLERFRDIVGPAHALDAHDDLARYTHENRHIYVGRTPLVLKPASTAEVARIMALASETRTEVVPQGGHTGHAAGAVPDESGTQIVVSLERMNRIRDIDTLGNTMTVEAGLVLESAQEAAKAHGRLFPLALGSQGSCQIGGNISTNAGGTGVLAYGNMRELVLGLEVVLPNGAVWDGLRRLKKDNTGYSLRNLFIGAEGTLGIVTAAVLRLFPEPQAREIAWAGMDTPEQALALLNLSLAEAGSDLTAFELIHRTPLEFALAHFPGSRDPLDAPHRWYVLMEVSSRRSGEDARGMMETILARAIEDGNVADAVVSQNLGQRDAFWRIREQIPPSQDHEGASIKHDISLPVHLVPEFLARANTIVHGAVAQARICAFGHMGDGNIHYNVSQPKGGDGAAFAAQREKLNGLIYALVVEMGGSISAEHGIGRLKRELMARTKSGTELALMRAIKAAVDPAGIMNPGKVL